MSGKGWNPEDLSPKLCTRLVHSALTAAPASRRGLVFTFPEHMYRENNVAMVSERFWLWTSLFLKRTQSQATLGPEAAWMESERGLREDEPHPSTQAGVRALPGA